MRTSAFLYYLTGTILSLATDTCGASTTDLADGFVGNGTNVGDSDSHNYTFSELSPKHYKMRQPYFHFMMLFRMKEPKVESHEHFSTIYADLTMAVKDTGVDILRYNQFHMDEQSKNKIKPLFTSDSVALAPYDAIAEFHAKDFDSLLRFIKRVYSDPAIGGELQNFFDLSAQVHYMAGYDDLIFGSGMKTSGGTNGILPNDRRLNHS